jgi:uncharacterized protein (DUF433 family)
MKIGLKYQEKSPFLYIDFNLLFTYFIFIIATELTMINIKDYFAIDKEILGGNPVFSGTRVPISSLFMHLEENISIDDFLEDFPTVKRNQVLDVLEIAGGILTSKEFEKLYEVAA